MNIVSFSYADAQRMFIVTISLVVIKVTLISQTLNSYLYLKQKKGNPYGLPFYIKLLISY